MKPDQLAAPAPARPLAPLAALLVLAVTAHALIVGCGKKGQDTESSSPPTGGEATQGLGDQTPPQGAPVAEGDLGTRIYAQRCALCHGAEGRGDGPASAGLNPKPRNHTDGAYMKTLSDDQLTEVIRDGKGAMPAWGKILSQEEIQALVVHVRSLAK